LSGLREINVLLTAQQRPPDKNVSLILLLWGKETRGPASGTPEPPTTDHLPGIVDSLKSYAEGLVEFNKSIHAAVSSSTIRKEELLPLVQWNGSVAIDP
jgi:hypothetical protein